MITVLCYGHIRTSVGQGEVTVDATEIDASDLVDRIRALSRERDPGFTKYNTLVMIQDGEAFVPAGARKVVRGGERVALVPFSHGG